jgi:flagellar biosynthesis protein FliQ
VNEAFLTGVAAQTLTVTLKLALPTLAVSLGVGLVVSLLQAVTQIQEQTLTFIPKAFGVALVLVIMGPWMLNTLLVYTVELYSLIPTLTES